MLNRHKNALERQFFQGLLFGRAESFIQSMQSCVQYVSFAITHFIIIPVLDKYYMDSGILEYPIPQNQFYHILEW